MTSSRVASATQKELLTILLTEVEAETILREYRGSMALLLSAPIEEVKRLGRLSDGKTAKLEKLLELIRRGGGPRENTTGIDDRVRALAARYKHEPREHVICLFTDFDNRIIGEEILSYGGLGGCFIDLPYMYRVACRLNSAGVVLLHNHPDGSTTPSKEDILLTEHVKKQLAVLDIVLIAHYVLGAGYAEQINQ